MKENEREFTNGLISFKIPRTVCFTMGISFASFLLIHFYMFCHKFYNNDDGIISDGGAGLTSGRWLKPIVCGISSEWTMPWFIGVLCALYMSLAIVAIVIMFNMTDKFAISALAIVMISFPTIAATASYITCVDSYIFALMLVCIGACVSVKFKFGWIAASVLFSLSLAIYQVYFSFALSLYIIYFILYLYSAYSAPSGN